MTARAAACLAAIVQRYADASSPSLDQWFFDEGLSTQFHLELEKLGYIERMLGTTTGFAWRLRNSGLAEARSRGWTS